jgi:ferrous iron transport protein A
MTLDQIEPGQTAIIQKLEFEEGFCKRCLALGLRCGSQVTVIRRALFSGPIHIRVGTTDICLRQTLAKLIKVL